MTFLIFMAVLIYLAIYSFLFKLTLLSFSFGVISAFVLTAFLVNCANKRQQRKEMEAKIERLANFSHYIPKDDYPEIYDMINKR